MYDLIIKSRDRQTEQLYGILAFSILLVDFKWNESIVDTG